MEILLGLLVLLFSAILHELAHGLVADKLGDPTPRLSGRLTLNPKSHIDPFMSVMLPLFLIITGSPVVFGAAKPVPIDPFNLKEGRKDVALVALSGPLTNIVIAVVASGILRVITLPAIYSIIPFGFIMFLTDFFSLVVSYNLLLAIFNLIPIPPLDGSKVFAMILPEKDAHAYLSLGYMGMFIILFLLMIPIGGFSLSNFIGNLLHFTQNILIP